MTDKLSEEERINLINYRLTRASETLAEAKMLADGGYFNSSISRLYYASYYAVSALLIDKGYSVGTHQGVKTMFSMHFIRTGLLPVRMGQLFIRLQEARQSSDYDDFVYCDLEMFEELYPQTQEFIGSIKDLLEK